MGGETEALPRDIDWAALTAALGGTMQSQLPLPGVIHAMAEDVSDPATARTMRFIADGLEKGESLESVLATLAQGKPTRLGHIIQAAALTGKPLQTWQTLLHWTDEYRQRLRDLRVNLGYPLLCFGIAIIVAVLLTFGWQVPMVADLSNVEQEFLLDADSASYYLPLVVRGTVVLLFVAAVAFLVSLAIFLFPEGVGRCSFVYSLPIFGRYYRFCNLTLLSRVAGHLLDCGVPSSQAFRTAAGLVPWPRLRRAIEKVAQQTGQSSTPVEAMQGRPEIPAVFKALVVYASDSVPLASRFEAAGDVFESRLGAMQEFVPSIYIAVFVALAFLLILASFVVPLIRIIMLIQRLSG